MPAVRRHVHHRGLSSACSAAPRWRPGLAARSARMGRLRGARPPDRPRPDPGPATSADAGSTDRTPRCMRAARDWAASQRAADGLLSPGDPPAPDTVPTGTWCSRAGGTITTGWSPSRSGDLAQERSLQVLGRPAQVGGTTAGNLPQREPRTRDRCQRRRSGPIRLAGAPPPSSDACSVIVDLHDLDSTRSPSASTSSTRSRACQAARAAASVRGPSTPCRPDGCTAPPAADDGRSPPRDARRRAASPRWECPARGRRRGHGRPRASRPARAASAGSWGGRTAGRASAAARARSLHASSARASPEART